MMVEEPLLHTHTYTAQDNIPLRLIIIIIIIIVIIIIIIKRSWSQCPYNKYISVAIITLRLKQFNYKGIIGRQGSGDEKGKF